MAKFRMGARRASRHDGDLFGRGFQYRDPERDSVKLRQWEELVPVEGTVASQNQLVALDYAFLRNGKIRVDYGVDVNTAVPYTFEAVQFLPLGGISGAGFVEFGHDGTDLIVRFVRQGSTQTQTVATSSPTNVHAAPWVDDFYFVIGFNTLYFYDTSANTITTVGGAPGGEFIFELANNILTVDDFAGAWQLRWSTDGDPTDWSGVGSGSAFLASTAGTPRDVVAFDEVAYIICTNGVIQVQPTGQSSPAHTLTFLSVVGCNVTLGACAAPNGMYYLGAGGEIVRFDGNNTTIVDLPIKLGGNNRLRYLQGYDAIAIFDVEDRVLFMDPSTNKLIGELSIDAIDGVSIPTNLISNYNARIYENTAPVEYTSHDLKISTKSANASVSLSTGKIFFGVGLWIGSVSFHWSSAHATSPEGTLTLTRTLRNGATTTDVIASANSQRVGKVVRYHINSYAESIKISWALESGINDNILEEIHVNISRESHGHTTPS